MTLRLNGDSSGFTEIKAADAAGDNSITLPANNGSVNELLKNSGTAGTLEYASGVTVNGQNRLGVQTADPAGHVHITSSYGGSVTNSGDNQCALVLESSAAAAQFAGPSLLFRGQTGNSTSVYGFGGIQGFKASTDLNNYTGGLRFFAQNSGGATVHEEVFRYSPSGISLIQGGINFAGIQAASLANATMSSETLDSYEEGRWEPQLRTASGTHPVYTQTQNYSTYTKIGRLVFFNADIIITFSNVGTGSMYFTLPFAVAAASEAEMYSGGGMGRNSTALNFNQNELSWYYSPGFHGALLYYQLTNGNEVAVNNSNFVTGSNKRFNAAGFYYSPT